MSSVAKYEPKLVPETDLPYILTRMIEATKTNADARKTAVRWFNRLYYDVRRWNESFIEFLRKYPGFADSKSPKDYKHFIEELEKYRDSLKERYGTVKHDLCTSLDILSARYKYDFAWLYEEDQNLFFSIRSMINGSFETEDDIIADAYVVCDFIYEISSDADWQIQHHNEVVNYICKYEDTSKKAVADLHQIAKSVGIQLLNISEYEEIINNEGSTNPKVMVIGEITMSNDNIHIHNVVGPVNVKARLDHVTQTVNNAPALADTQKQEFSVLIEELKQALEPAASVKSDDTERVIETADMVAKEVSKEKPNKSFLNLTTEGLKEAAKAVQDVAPSVLTVATSIAAFVAKYF